MSTPLKCLFLEDQPNDLFLVQRRLRDVATVDVAMGRDAFAEMLKEDWAVIMLDWRLHDMTCPEAVELVRKTKSDVPLLLITGSITDEAAASALRLGFVDYLRKDRLERLPHAVLEAHKNYALKEKLRERDMRKQRDEILGTLAAALAHDQRNYLGSIIMGIGLLRDKVGPREQFILDSMAGAAKKGSDQVEQMMTFAKGANGTSFKNVTAEFILGEVRRMMQFKADESRVRLQVRTDVGTANVRCDPVQINTVLVNMATNAIQAMPDGGELFLEARTVLLNEPPLEGRYTCFTVRDTGHGIPPDVLPRIFDPYFSTKGNKGTGLGLAMVKLILESHHGSVEVRCDGSGTTFFVYLPVFQGEPEAKPETFDGNGATVLLVDDEEGFRSITQMLLENANYRVKPACNGPEAISFFRSSERIDVLVSDLSMPIMCGQELSRHLREQGINVPTIYITGREFEQAIKPEPDAILHKPFERAQLLRTLADVLTRAGGQDTDKA